MSFLASLLSDTATAAGELNERGQIPDKSKVWAMGFLAEFNPDGHLASEDPEALRNFAQQIINERDQYEPVTAAELETRKMGAKIPSKDVLKLVIQSLRDEDVDVSIETILEEVEEYYEDKKMLLPDGWEKITENNLKKWKLI